MGSFTITYPGGYYDSETGLVCTRYAKTGKMAVVWPLFRNGDRASKAMNMILPETISAKMKAKLRKEYEFKRYVK